MMATRKKKKINIENYKRLISENKLLAQISKKLEDLINLPIKNFLEIGTGTCDFMTKYFVLKERSKDIEKFYAMEPVDELFEESKRHVVRLSRTDATSQEFFGGNPFNTVFAGFVISHIFPDKKLKFLKNLRNNLQRGGTYLSVDLFLPEYKDDDEKVKSTQEFYKTHIDYAKKTKQEYLMNYFVNVSKEVHDDFWSGQYKISIGEYTKLLEKARFKDIEITLFEGKGKYDWEKLGYYIVKAVK